MLCLTFSGPCAAQNGRQSSLTVPTVTIASVGAPALPLSVTPRAHRYATTRYILYFVGTAYELFLLWVVLHFGLSARMRNVSERAWRRTLPFQYRLHRWGRRKRRHLSPKGQRLWVIFLYGPRCCWRHASFWWRRFVMALVYGFLLILALAAAHFPLFWYSDYWMEHQYGLSHQSILGWLSDYGTDLCLNLMAGCIYFALLWLVYKAPRRWSLWLWGIMIPIIAAGIFVGPIVFDPIYNKFMPLPNGPLRTRLEHLAAKAGIPHAPILVADQSKRTTTANAYVTGLGGTARIVIWDTTLKQLDNDEVVGIVAHEMGHYKLHHVERGFWESVFGLLLALPILQGMVTALIRRYGLRWKVHAVHDLAAVPIFLLVLSLLTFLSEPATNFLSRQIEHEADAYGLALSGDGPAMARAFAFFVAHDLDDPYPPAFIKFWLFSHPPTGERVEFVLGRKPPVFGETTSHD